MSSGTKPSPSSAGSVTPSTSTVRRCSARPPAARASSPSLCLEDAVVRRFDRRLQRVAVRKDVLQRPPFPERALEVVDEIVSPAVYGIDVVDRVVLQDERRLQQRHVKSLAAPAPFAGR